jgi:mRNA-degrading endonuclease YafQ of YafQ-DinJ toxin-antitoxin module
MRTPVFKKECRKDIERMKARSKKMDKLFTVLEGAVVSGKISPQYRSHKLTGE